MDKNSKELKIETDKTRAEMLIKPEEERYNEEIQALVDRETELKKKIEEQ